MPARKTALGEFATAFAALVISYWLFVGEVSMAETSLAVSGAACAALWAVSLSRAAEVPFRFDRKAFVTFAGAVAGMPRAAARVTFLLLTAGRHRPRGGIIELPFDHGRDRNAADATRRAATLLAISLAPDRFALLQEDNCLRVHRLVAEPPGGDKQWPA